LIENFQADFDFIFSNAIVIAIEISIRIDQTLIFFLCRDRVWKMKPPLAPALPPLGVGAHYDASALPFKNNCERFANRKLPRRAPRGALRRGALLPLSRNISADTY
jgi:hypothetical protein